jgi:hypothetical protein
MESYMGYYNRINLFIPTFRRISCGRFIKCVRSAISQADDIKNICITVLINEDDDESQEYFKNPVDLTCDYQVLHTNTFPPSLSKFFNQIYDQTKFNDPQTLASMIGDDMVFITKGYDTAILNKINEIDGVGMVYCDDDYCQHDNMCVNLFTTRKLISATGKPFMCELFPVDFIDSVWMNFSRRMGLFNYLGDVKIKHEHSPNTATWMRLRNFYFEAAKNVHLLNGYVDEMCNNVIKSGIMVR